MKIKPYSKITTIEMWTDPYISKQMLKYHLNKDTDIASRKEETIIKTCEFISNYIGPNKTICDFGCGPGLYTSKLAFLGHRVFGVDVSNSSLEYARSLESSTKYMNFNYVEQALKEKIDVAMMIYCDFGALTKKNRTTFLNNLKKSLKQGGYFIFDVFSYHRFSTIKENTVTYKETDGFFMPGDAEITTEVVTYPDEYIALFHDLAIGSKVVELYNWDQHYSQETMKKYMNQNGFEIVDCFSDTIGGKDFKDNDILFFICKRK